jgi:hypothetical protein
MFKAGKILTALQQQEKVAHLQTDKQNAEKSL